MDLEANSWFSGLWGRQQLLDLYAAGLSDLGILIDGGGPPRVAGPTDVVSRDRLLRQYGRLPVEPSTCPEALTRGLVADLFAGAVNWRSPQAQHNIGSAVNAVSAAVQALAATININLINSDQGGNAVLAEQAVGRIMAELAGTHPQRTRALFTFGGTGTVLYGLKAGLAKAVPNASRQGTPSDAVVVTVANAHFAAVRAADWLGIGSARVLVVAEGRDGRGDLGHAETVLRGILDGGGRVAGIMVNGGTTLDHTVDDIAGFAALRDRLTVEYRLPYRPHLHVDAVIGWAWLCVGIDGVDPSRWGADDATVAALTEQFHRISAVRFADSWGVDFHKGPGCVALDSSCVLFNDAADLARLDGDVDVGYVGPRSDVVTNIDHTLETARAADKALAALAALHALGAEGVSRILTDLVGGARRLRELIGAHDDWTVLNPSSLGYHTALRPRPPGAPREFDVLTAEGPGSADHVRMENAYVTAFFEWDNRTRMQKGAPGVLYSFCAAYRMAACGEPVVALKFYPVSPLIAEEHLGAAVHALVTRKAEFDAAR
ncbi:pyridoxal-dependent decarboxylase [Nocardia sp. NPDC004582]